MADEGEQMRTRDGKNETEMDRTERKKYRNSRREITMGHLIYMKLNEVRWVDVII